MRKRPNKCAKCNGKSVLMQTFDNICGTARLYYVRCSNAYCGQRTYVTDTKDKAVDDWNKGRVIR